MSFILIHLVSPFSVSLPSLSLPNPFLPTKFRWNFQSEEATPLHSCPPIILPSRACWWAATLLHLCPSLSSPLPCRENHPDLEGGIGISYNGWAARGSARDRGKDGRREYTEGKERWKRLLMREDRGTDTEIKLCRHWQGNWQDNQDQQS